MKEKKWILSKSWFLQLDSLAVFTFSQQISYDGLSCSTNKLFHNWWFIDVRRFLLNIMSRKEE